MGGELVEWLKRGIIWWIIGYTHSSELFLHEENEENEEKTSETTFPKDDLLLLGVRFLADNDLIRYKYVKYVPQLSNTRIE